MANLRFIVSLITKENDYQLEQAADAQAAAKKLGVDVQILYADNDAITQSTQLLKAIQCDAAERPEAIIFEPAGGTAFPQVAQAAVSAKIAWAALNREADYIPQLRKTAKVPVFCLSSDHKEIGRIQGRQFAALLPKGGTVMYIQGPSETSAAQARTAGMQMTVSHGVQIVSLRGRWTEESAQTAVEKWLRLTFTGVDGLAKTVMAWVRSGALAATVVVPNNTGQAISMLVEALQTGRDVPERSYTSPESFPAIEKLAAKSERFQPTV